MKISRHTKDKVATVKEESMQVKRQLETMHIRLSEHPGTKRIASKLERVIHQLEQWQQAA